jgi:hypothetical protein
MEVLETGNDKVFAFRRAKDGNVVGVAVNLSGAPQQYALAGKKETLGAWEYRVSAPQAREAGRLPLP